MGLSAEQITVIAIVSQCFSLLFLLISVSLSFDGLGGMKLKWDLQMVSQNPGGASFSLYSVS